MYYLSRLGIFYARLDKSTFQQTLAGFCSFVYQVYQPEKIQLCIKISKDDIPR